MSAALQIVIIVAVIAVALIVLLMIPLSILIYRHVINFSRQLEGLTAELKGLVQDSRTLVKNISSVTCHVNEQLAELDRLAGIIAKWSGQINHVAGNVGATIEAPFLKVKRSVQTFFQISKFIVRLAGETLRQTDPAEETTRENHK